MMNKYIILLLGAFTLFSCSQKTNANDPISESENTVGITKIYTLREYQEDFNQMVELLLKKHAQPYAFISKDSLEYLINIQYNKITDSTTKGGFLWICLEVVSAINCGHSIVWSGELDKLPESMLFPMNIKYIGSKLYVLDAKNNSNKLSAGDEILAINGVDVETLQKEIFKHLPSDGYIESNKLENASVYFRYMCAMFYGFPTSFNVTVKQNGKMEEIKLVEAENFNPTKTFLDNCENKLCFDTDIKSNTAILTIRSFSYYKGNFEIFKSFIDSCFYQINENKIQNLIIDLRNNSGGNPFCGSYLLQHIADKPYTYFHKSVKRYSKLKKAIQPNPNGFKGKPYILINGKCFSTTGHFCSLAKENNFGVFIGDETGATYTCNDFSKFYTLKNTKFTFRVATQIVKTTASTLTNKHGIIPTHYVVPGIDDYLTNTDTVLNYTLRLIEKEKLVFQQ